MDQNEFINMENITPSETRLSKKLRAIFSSNAFLTATVALTVVAALALMMGTIDIFSTLFAIGMWLVYTASKKETPTKAMKFLSGTFKAYYIVNIIGIVCLVISGVLLIAIAPSVIELRDDIYDILNTATNGYTNLFFELSGEDIEIVRTLDSWVAENVGIALSVFLGAVMIVLGVIFIISAVITLIINIFFVRKLSKRLKDAASALEMGSEYDLSLDGFKIWFTIFGVFNAIIAVMTMLGAGIFAAISGAASAVSYFAISSAISAEPKVEANQAPPKEPLI